MASKNQNLPTPAELATIAAIIGDSDAVRGMRHALDLYLRAELELNDFAEREQKHQKVHGPGTLFRKQTLAMAFPDMVLRVRKETAVAWEQTALRHYPKPKNGVKDTVLDAWEDADLRGKAEAMRNAIKRYLLAFSPMREAEIPDWFKSYGRKDEHGQRYIAVDPELFKNVIVMVKAENRAAATKRKRKERDG